MKLYGDIFGAAMEINSIAKLRSLVKATRLEQGLTQADLATKAHVSRKWLGEFERGDTVGELRPLWAVIDALDIKLIALPREQYSESPGDDPVGDFIDRSTRVDNLW